NPKLSTFSGNILSVPRDVDNEGQQQYDLLFIDYEYCGYNYRGFDLANHFNEWMWDYKHEEAPYYLYNPELFPSLEQQVCISRKPDK
ncbi:predicted protein, partial [Nematostella vectensis]